MPDFMSFDAFVTRLFDAGWRAHADAQHTGARAMYRELFGKPAAMPAAGHIPLGDEFPEPHFELRLPPFDGVEAAQMAERRPNATPAVAELIHIATAIERASLPTLCECTNGICAGCRVEGSGRTTAGRYCRDRLQDRA